MISDNPYLVLTHKDNDKKVKCFFLKVLNINPTLSQPFDINLC